MGKNVKIISIDLIPKKLKRLIVLNSGGENIINWLNDPDVEHGIFPQLRWWCFS
jgi:hypothetical protein